MSDSILTIKDAAKYLKVHWQTVRSYIKRGDLRVLRVGRFIRIREREIQRFISKREKEQEKLEIEIRFLLYDRKRVEKKLIDLNAKVIFQGHVVDHWYVPNSIKNNQQKNDWYESGKGYGLRIREQDNGYTGKILTSLEIKKLAEPYNHGICIESEIDVRSYRETDSLLRLANYKEFMTIDKDRIVYSYNGYKISIDNIKYFGVGIEIEKITTEKKEKVIKKLKSIAKKIGLDLKKELVDKSVTYLAMEKLAEY